MSTTTDQPRTSAPGPEPERRSGELGFVELLRWTWRQLTSMRTALILLLLLALASVPGSFIPQKGVDALKTSTWQGKHPKLTPIYERLGLFEVYDSPWFAAIYLLLGLSVIGCVVPRLRNYWKAMRAAPVRAPRHLTRMPDHATYTTDASPEEVLERAERVLRERRFRVADRTPEGPGADAVAAEKGKLREAGNLVFHFSILVVMVGFAIGSLFGYKGGVIVPVDGGGFSNNLTQYDDFDPGTFFDPAGMEPFSFQIQDFTVDWVESGRNQGMSRGFVSEITYKESPDSPQKDYHLRVNEPLSIGGTDVFLIGHGYSPVVTIRDGTGKVVATGPTVFLPQGQDLFSFGVIKAPYANPDQIGLEGVFYPTYVKIDGDPINVMGDDRNPTLSMQVYRGDLGLDDGSPQSVYILDKDKATQVMRPDDPERPLRIDLQPGQRVRLPNGLGTVSFDGVEEWNRVQISRTPGMWLTLSGVVAALIGMMGSLFIRPRRAWVRARRGEQGTLVEVAVLDRSGGADVTPELDAVVAALQGRDDGPDDPRRARDE